MYRIVLFAILFPVCCLAKGTTQGALDLLQSEKKAFVKVIEAEKKLSPEKGSLKESEAQAELILIESLIKDFKSQADFKKACSESLIHLQILAPQKELLEKSKAIYLWKKIGCP